MKIKEIMAAYGLIMMGSMTIIMTITFMIAYFHPDKAVNIAIDSYGEANIEFIGILLAIPCCIYAWHKSINRVV